MCSYECKEKGVGGCMILTVQQKETLRNSGFIKAGDIGGQPKQTYWTPDGREIRALPDMNEYSLKDANGKTIRSGVRDANLDKGWLMQKPVELKPYCPHCDAWHDNQEGIDACGRKKAQFMRKCIKEIDKEPDRIAKLENDMSELKGLLKQLLEVQIGNFLQSKGNTAQANPRKETDGTYEGRIQ